MVGESSIKKQKKKRPHSESQENKNKQKDESVCTEESERVTEHNENPSHSSLRRLSESDSDNANEPKKKKKKKKKTEFSSAQPNNKNKSIRQAKREKFAQRQAENVAAAKQQTKSECLNYLSQWKHNKHNWKFMKAKQVWLYKNKFSESLIPKESWSLLLEYFESAKGNIRTMLLDDANKIIKQMDDWTESQKCEDANSENEDNENEIKKPDEAIYKRARELLQFLQE
ncbi:unnamed protein product [Chilo suppressalis]|uniref:WKF domain-containing protein n=1 Tax=Chilo suppressalis TaxID=168631 RepID=A0ABN8ASA5_CHISP|nr:unnamed protein product [Chilo suppressalis]